MDINDPASVKVLLDGLLASQAWKDAIIPPNLPPDGLSGSGHEEHRTTPPEISAPPPVFASEPEEDSIAASSCSTLPGHNSVASLLAQLHSIPPSQNPSTCFAPPDSGSANSFHQPSGHESVAPAAHSYDHSYAPNGFLEFASPEDRRTYSYQQALPILGHLSQDPHFTDTITQMKKEQDDLEKQLWEQREDVRRKFEDRFKAAKERAKIIGSEITKHEADMLSDAYRKELTQFGTERALPLWDGLVQQQQEKLEQLGVPTMFSTTAPTDRNRQQRIIPVIEGLLT